MLFLDSSNWRGPCKQSEMSDRHGDNTEVLLLPNAVVDAERHIIQGSREAKTETGETHMQVKYPEEKSNHGVAQG